MSDVRFLQLTDKPIYAVELDWLMTPLNLITEGASLQSGAR